MKNLLFSIFTLLSISTAQATVREDINTTYKITAQNWATIKVISINCDFPVGEYISIKARIIDTLLNVPNIDILYMERDMERKFEAEERFENIFGNECHDLHPERYKSLLRTIENDIDRLRDLISQL